MQPAAIGDERRIASRKSVSHGAKCAGSASKAVAVRAMLARQSIPTDDCCALRFASSCAVRKLMRPESVVYIVDDDESVRESLVELLLSAGLPAEAFASAEEFLVQSAPERAACLILDVTMPGMSGPQLQERLLRDALTIPIVFITAMSEERVRTRALERGALAWLVKPFGDEELLSAVQTAIDGERV